MEQHNARPSDARACKLSALLTPVIKRTSVGKCMRIADARQIEIVMRHATFISTLRESHLPFQERLQQQAAHEPQRGSPDGVRKPPDEAMTIIELLSLHLSVDGLVKAIACDQRFQKTPWPNA